MNAQDLRDTADFFVSSGLAGAGYTYVSTDDGWMSGRDANGRMIADPLKFPGGWPALSAYVHGKGLKLGLYSAASSVVCSGRVGSLYNEDIDAETFASWGIDYVKYDVRFAHGRRFIRPRTMLPPHNPILRHPPPSPAPFFFLVTELR